jgi:hypothetical protein
MRRGCRDGRSKLKEPPYRESEGKDGAERERENGKIWSLKIQKGE